MIVSWKTAQRAMQEERTASRWLALDLLRFVAALLMVQGHTFTELLDASTQRQSWYPHHQFVHGYTAPMFLFASGLAFGYTTFRHWERATQPGDALYKRLRRYGWLLVIGYLLHVPTLALGGLVSAGDGTLRAWLQVDVLQHIGVSLSLLQLLAVALRRYSGNAERGFATIVLALFVLAVFSAPLVWAWPADQHLPLALAGFVNGSSGSTFALVPWAGFTYAGVLVAYALRNAREPSRTLAPWLLGVTLVTLGVPVILNRMHLQPYGPHDFWRTSPYYFFFRLGNVTAVLTVLAYAELGAVRFGLAPEVVGGDADPFSSALDARLGVAAPRNAAGIPSEPRLDPRTDCSPMTDRHFRLAPLGGDGRIARALGWVRVVGEQSLVVYVAHLLILHGWVVRPGLASSMGHGLSLVQCSIVALAIFTSMMLVARAWSDVEKSRLRFQAVQVSAAGAMAYLMLIAR